MVIDSELHLMPLFAGFEVDGWAFLLFCYIKKLFLDVNSSITPHYYWELCQKQLLGKATSFRRNKVSSGHFPLSVNSGMNHENRDAWDLSNVIVQSILPLLSGNSSTLFSFLKHPSSKRNQQADMFPHSVQKLMNPFRRLWWCVSTC